jgi:hypothetical protein
MHCNGWASDLFCSETNTHEERKLTDVHWPAFFCQADSGGRKWQLAGLLTDLVRVLPYLGYNITKKNMNGKIFFGFGFWVLGFGFWDKGNIF